MATFTTLTYAARSLIVLGFIYDDLSSSCYYPHFEDEESEASRPPQEKRVQLRFTTKSLELTPTFNHCTKQWHIKHIAHSEWTFPFPYGKKFSLIIRKWISNNG